MRADASVEGREQQRPNIAADEKARIAERIAELMTAGLVSAELDDDGAISYALTSAGEKTACQMAMHRGGHALVLLGALISSSEGLN